MWSPTSKNCEKKVLTGEELNLSWKLGEDQKKRKGRHWLKSRWKPAKVTKSPLLSLQFGGGQAPPGYAYASCTFCCWFMQRAMHGKKLMVLSFIKVCLWQSSFFIDVGICIIDCSILTLWAILICIGLTIYGANYSPTTCAVTVALTFRSYLKYVRLTAFDDNKLRSELGSSVLKVAILVKKASIWQKIIYSALDTPSFLLLPIQLEHRHQSCHATCSKPNSNKFQIFWTEFYWIWKRECNRFLICKFLNDFLLILFSLCSCTVHLWSLILL